LKPPAARSPVTASTGAETGHSTAPSTPSPPPGCAATPAPRPTCSAAVLKANPTGKSGAASSDTSPVSSTAPSPPS
jgi:hypothetical protein